MKTSLKITEKAKNNVFDKCNVYGKTENEGSNNIFKQTRFGLQQRIKENLVKTIIIGTIIVIIGLLIEYNFFK